MEQFSGVSLNSDEGSDSNLPQVNDNVKTATGLSQLWFMCALNY